VCPTKQSFQDYSPAANFIWEPAPPLLPFFGVGHLFFGLLVTLCFYCWDGKKTRLLFSPPTVSLTHRLKCPKCPLRQLECKHCSQARNQVWQICDHWATLKVQPPSNVVIVAKRPIWVSVQSFCIVLNSMWLSESLVIFIHTRKVYRIHNLLDIVTCWTLMHPNIITFHIVTSLCAI
jgi:hypothetical protein